MSEFFDDQAKCSEESDQEEEGEVFSEDDNNDFIDDGDISLHDDSDIAESINGKFFYKVIIIIIIIKFSIPFFSFFSYNVYLDK